MHQKIEVDIKQSRMQTVECGKQCFSEDPSTASGQRAPSFLCTWYGKQSNCQLCRGLVIDR